MLRALGILVAVALVIFSFVDCLRAPQAYLRGPRYAWLLAIVVLPVLGSVLYLFAGRELRGGVQVRRVTAPDDDPDFLRSLDQERKGKSGDDEDHDL